MILAFQENHRVIKGVYSECMVCFACSRRAAEYVVQLALAPDAAGGSQRVYLPNQHVRDAGLVEPVGFCRPCIRVVEEGLRNNIRQLRAV
jgi:hypothetical protein